jgi:hypothetical protein
MDKVFVVKHNCVKELLNMEVLHTSFTTKKKALFSEKISPKLILIADCLVKNKRNSKNIYFAKKK